MIRRIIFLWMLWLFAAGAAWATPAGDEYWLDMGVFPVVAGQFQVKADPSGKALDTFLGGGLGVGHVGGFAWQALLEGGGLPVAKTGQVRAEARLGYWRITIGPSYSTTIAPRLVETLGPAIALDWPLTIGPSPREGRDNVLSVFYRLDVPVNGKGENFQLRHQVGVRFLFDLPELAISLLRPAPQWLGPNFH
jgi:hypothetical protein